MRALWVTDMDMVSHTRLVRGVHRPRGSKTSSTAQVWMLNGWKTSTARRDTNTRPRYGSAIARMSATTVLSHDQRPTLFEGLGLFDEGPAIAQDIRLVHSTLLCV
ncbi:hypothetical protein C8Q74DRAFT_293283 [Fomes fomentarius]|nr:hypothetical protein C8Q74DRAFT_293283 [Fomes fomentarius]